VGGVGGQPFSYEGKFFRIPETVVFPQPVQRPHPPIWVTAQSPESVEAAVRRGFHVLTGGFGVPIERMAEFRRLFDRLVAEELRRPSPASTTSWTASWSSARRTRASARSSASGSRSGSRMELFAREVMPAFGRVVTPA
jgi:alkanesulfonate monooxygenase SsuD/methylene tetrahydromethanopterin reductase-like flavin-dependent oxidoreductase (luciferase family)